MNNNNKHKPLFIQQVGRGERTESRKGYVLVDINKKRHEGYSQFKERVMEDYIVIKELIDARVGTLVVWNQAVGCYSYQKSWWVSPHSHNYLPEAQVTQTPEYFCKRADHYTLYADNNPVYSYKEIVDLVNTNLTKISSAELLWFESSLQKVGRENAKRILDAK